MRIRPRAQEQVVLAYILQIRLDDLGTVIGVIHLDAIERDLCSHLIEQSGIIEGEAALAPTWVSDQADSPTAVCRIDSLRHICHDRLKTRFADHAYSGLPVCRISVLA